MSFKPSGRVFVDRCFGVYTREDDPYPDLSPDRLYSQVDLWSSQALLNPSQYASTYEQLLGGLLIPIDDQDQRFDLQELVLEPYNDAQNNSKQDFILTMYTSMVTARIIPEVEIELASWIAWIEESKKGKPNNISYPAVPQPESVQAQKSKGKKK